MEPGPQQALASTANTERERERDVGLWWYSDKKKKMFQAARKRREVVLVLCLDSLTCYFQGLSMLALRERQSRWRRKLSSRNTLTKYDTMRMKGKWRENGWH